MIVEIVALSILSIQVVYIILFLIAFIRKQKKLQVPSGVPVSIIVCAHDEEENLKELIPQLLGQNYPEFEVIIVEDKSNDGTFDFLLEATHQNPRLKMVRVQQTPEHINGKKFGLTLGIKAAKHEWILLTDADCRPQSENWITSMSKQFDEPTQIVLGVSPYERQPSLLNDFIRFESFLTAIQFVGWALLGLPYMGVGRNLAYRKSLFINTKGFNTHLSVMGGDDDLFVNQHAQASNTRICLDKESLMKSKPKTSWTDFYYQKLRHLSVGKHYKFFDRIGLGMFSVTWILTWIFVLPFAFFSPLLYPLLAGLMVRWGLLTLLFHYAVKKMGDHFDARKIPYLDFIYTFYYLVAGPVALVSKKVRWKKN